MVGVPEITPAEVSPNPRGKAPVTTPHVYVAEGTACSVKVYGVFTDPDGIEIVLICTDPLPPAAKITTLLKLRKVCDVVSLTVTVKE